MKKNVCLITYIHVKLNYVFVIYLDYVKNMLKKVGDKQKWFLEDKKNQHKIYKCAKKRIN